MFVAVKQMMGINANFRGNKTMGKDQLDSCLLPKAKLFLLVIALKTRINQ